MQRTADRSPRHRPVGRRQRARLDLTEITRRICSAGYNVSTVTSSPKEACMPNPLLNDKGWNQAAKNPGWGAPDPVTRAAPTGGGPITDGPISPWSLNTMTVAGTI